ncbi:hypothetical protein ACH5RR_040099 [Cinchona calisaya]|uniref:Disease resistance protein n=1 Tax=Cinchona calisaya TaxID=153742 RepID=A0ABD2XRD1_9GENT
MGKLTQLRELSITKLRSEEGKEPCSSLGKLTNLRKLFVYSIKVDEILDLQHPISPIPRALQLLSLSGKLEKAGGFQKLKKLELQRLQQLKWVRVEKDALPYLQYLTMADCKQVNELPWGIQNLNELQNLGFYNMGNELVMKLHDKGSEEYQKVVKIPEIVIANWIDGQWDQHIL